MRTVIQDFEDRVKEVDRFFDLLQKLENPQLRVVYPTRRGSRGNGFDSHCLQILKATAFLLLYNLIESAIRSGLGAVYGKIRAKNLRVPDLRKELRKIWIGQHLGGIDLYSATAATYRAVAEELVTSVIEGVCVDLRKEDLRISGNLDARKVREVCEKHAIGSRSHYRARGGTELVTVKDQRNALAHGDISFSDCGRQYTIDDLERIKRQAIVFTRSILRNIKKYVDREGYLV